MQVMCVFPRRPPKLPHLWPPKLLPFCPGSEELNVLKPHLQITIATLLARGESQHEIARRTGVDRKTIRRYAEKGDRFIIPEKVTAPTTR